MAAFPAKQKPVHSAWDAVVVTPHDTNTIGLCRALYIGSTGNIAVRMASGNSATFSSVPVGVFPIQVDQVLSTGTTASSIMALY